MKWHNHEIMAFTIPLAFTGNIFVAAGSILFAVLPDSIEGKGAPEEKFLKHRGNSHNPFVWGTALLLLNAGMAAYEPQILQWFKGYGMIVTKEFLFYLWLCPVFGLYAHLFGDSLTIGGIPLWKGKKLAFKLFKTGSPLEYLITYSTLAAAVYFRLQEIRNIF